MTIKRKHTVSFLLLVSGLLLSSLVPGGPIENRDFSHINAGILLTFNIYLTVLGLGSFVLIPHVLRAGRYAGMLGVLSGLSYLVVYAVDLLGWFPKTPTEMSIPLVLIEVIGMVLALPLVYVSNRLPRNGRLLVDHNISNWTDPKWLLLGISGIAIVVFATWSAMAPSA
jgi:hypothetical protein